MQVEGQREGSLRSSPATGARVRNAYRPYPLLGNSLAKARLMPDVPRLPHGKFGKDLLVKDGDASH